jgi:hypothetical protein
MSWQRPARDLCTICAVRFPTFARQPRTILRSLPCATTAARNRRCGLVRLQTRGLIRRSSSRAHDACRDIVGQRSRNRRRNAVPKSSRGCGVRLRRLWLHRVATCLSAVRNAGLLCSRTRGFTESKSLFPLAHRLLYSAKSWQLGFRFPDGSVWSESCRRRSNLQCTAGQKPGRPQWPHLAGNSGPFASSRSSKMMRNWRC